MTDSRLDEEVFEEYLDEIRAACYKKLLNSRLMPRSDKAHPMEVSLINSYLESLKQTENK